MRRKTSIKSNRAKRKHQRNNEHDYFDRYYPYYVGDGIKHHVKHHQDCECGQHHSCGCHHQNENHHECRCSHHKERPHDCSCHHHVKHHRDCDCDFHKENRHTCDCNHHDERYDCGCDHHDENGHDCDCYQHGDHQDCDCCNKRRKNHYVLFGCDSCNKHHDYSQGHNRCDCRCHLCLNLARLNDNLNFKLLRNKNRPLEMVTVGNRRFRGKTKHVGIDYVDIKDNNGKMLTILKDKIEYIDWKKERKDQERNW